MPKVASIVSHNNAFAPSVDSDTIRGGIRSKIDTAANLAALFDPDAALQSNNNSQDLVKEKGTIVYVEDQSDYFILNDATNSDIAPGSAGSGWITLLSAIGGGSPTAAPAIVDNSGTPALASGISAAEIQSEIGLVPGIASNNILQATNSGNTLADNDFLRVDGTKIEGLTAGEVVTALNLTASDVGLGNVENAAASGIYLPLAGGTVTGNLAVNGNTTLGNAAADTVTVTADIASNLIPDGNDTRNLGASGTEWAHLYVDNITATSDVTVTGNLTVSGNFVQANSTIVDFEDAVLALGVPRDSSNVIENGTSSIDTGLNFVKVTAGNAITEFAAFRYDIGTDTFRFTRHADAGDFSEGVNGVGGGADNVVSLKFTHSDTVSQTDQADAGTTMPVGQFANAASVRALGAVAKCTIEITTASVDGDSGSGTANTNFAPDIMGANGYVIKHNLGTQSVFVVAIKTHNSSGSALADPVPVFCKYIPENDNVIRVTVGITAADEKYDIIVIG
jgi:hypothetical protein|tara:strand:- start:1977 stop:3500 length:1524 start_codon:yes stop_codon:yes gene_type:complete